MAQNSYIKDLSRYPVGSGAIYTNLDDCITVSNSTGIGLSKDGTGINELWKFRSQFTLPSTISRPDCTSAGRDVLSPTKYSDIAKYYVVNIANTTLGGVVPYKASQLRGAVTFYAQFVTGTGETPPNKIDRYSCSFSRPDHCIMQAFCWARSALAAAFSEFNDMDSCFRWVYFNNTASFSIQVHGGYGSTGQFRVTLTNPYMGTIAATAGTDLFNEGTTITYIIPRASNSGQDRYYVGEYTLTIVDVITNSTLVVYVFVPVAGWGDFTMRSKSYTQSFTPGTTYCANNDNSLWIAPLPPTPAAPAANMLTPELSSIDTTVSCTNTPLTITTFKAIIKENIEAVTYTFQYRIPPTIAAWTNVAAPITIPAASISVYEQPISARLTTTTAALTGEWQLVLTNTVSTVTLTAVPFKLSEPFLEVTAGPITKTPAGGTNYTITQSIDTQSCTNYTLSVLQWNTDQTAAFVAAPSSIPAGFVTAATFTNVGGATTITNNFAVNLNSTTSTTYTFLAVAAHTLAPYTNKRYPLEYYTPATTGPSPPTPPLTVAATSLFNVVTLP